MAALTAEALVGVAKSLESLSPDLLIVLGDRYEAFAAASAASPATYSHLPFAWRETATGAIDDRLRHAISQLSSWHFTSAESYRERVISMGHPVDHVFNVGPMVLDSLVNMPIASRSNFEEETGFRFSDHNLLVTYHPETLCEDLGYSGFEALLNALQSFSCNILFTHPNADEGSQQIISRMNEFVNVFPRRSWIIPSLGFKTI